MGLLLLATAFALAACPDRAALIDEVTANVVSADLFAARTRLTDLEESFGCGELATDDQLVSLWLLDAALSTFSGDPERAADAFRAAAAVEPNRFIEDLGAHLRRRYEAAQESRPSGRGTVHIEPVLAGWTLAVDGVVQHTPLDIAPGLHLVQVGPTPATIVYAQVIQAVDSTTVVVDTQLPPILLRDPVTTNPRTQPTAMPQKGSGPTVKLAWTAGTGVGLAMGERLEDAVGVEPALKMRVPLETGVRLRFTNAWMRFVVGAGPFLGGTLLYAEDGRAVTTPVFLTTHVAGGWRSDSIAAGAAAVLLWPGRIGVRGVAAVPLGALPLELEGRLGLNAATQRRSEPAVELMLTVFLESR